MTVLPLDMPDDYHLLPGSEKNPSSDVGELAVRLGSIVGYDRRGVVVFMDDFSHGVYGWDFSQGAAGGAREVSVERSMSAGFACKLTTSPNAGTLTGMTKTLHPLNKLRLGFEVSFSENASMRTLRLIIFYQSDDVQYTAEIRYLFQTNILQYIDSASATVTLATIKTLTTGSQNFSTIKLVIDPNTAEFVRVLFNNETFDMTGIALPSVANVQSDRIVVNFAASPDDAVSRNIYFDNVIVTVGDL